MLWFHQCSAISRPVFIPPNLHWSTIAATGKPPMYGQAPRRAHTGIISPVTLKTRRKHRRENKHIERCHVEWPSNQEPVLPERLDVLFLPVGSAPENPYRLLQFFPLSLGESLARRLARLHHFPCLRDVRLCRKHVAEVGNLEDDCS
eukprot:scaffold1878_cov258-Pinguiococcus_pyrenoidosus.AAC.24